MPDQSSKKNRKRPRDTNQLAHSVFLEAIGEAPEREKPEESDKNPAAVALGRLGGLKGGKARAAKLTSEERSRIARKAAMARWRAATAGDEPSESTQDARRPSQEPPPHQDDSR